MVWGTEVLCSLTVLTACEQLEEEEQTDTEMELVSAAGEREACCHHKSEGADRGVSQRSTPMYSTSRVCLAFCNRRLCDHGRRSLGR